MSDLPEDEARAALRACCAAGRWVERMLSQRPFKNRDEVFDSAEHIWWSLGREDWLEAFAAHPRIGAQRHSGTAAQDDSKAPEWSQAEQAGAAAASDETKAALAEVNREYEAKFGYIYIVCATGKSGEEMLALARQRLGNDADTELRVAALEQLNITRLRLEKQLTL